MLSLCLFIVGLCKTPVDPIRVSESPERLVLQLAYASGDQSRLDILMRFFTVMYRTYLV